MKLKEWVGLLIILLGVFFGLYCGLWWGFVGGFIVIVEQIRAEEISATMVTWGFLRMLVSWMLGWFIFAIFATMGAWFSQS